LQKYHKNKPFQPQTRRIPFKTIKFALGCDVCYKIRICWHILQHSSYFVGKIWFLGGNSERLLVFRGKGVGL